MLDEHEYASSTDESDDDYKPDGENSDVPSEIDTDDDNVAENNDADNKDSKRKNRKRKSLTTKLTAKKKKDEPIDIKKDNCDVLKEDNDDEDEDAIWASFLSKAGETAIQAPKINSNQTQTQVKPASSSTNTMNKIQTKFVKEKPTQTVSSSTEMTKTITEVFEFAGEKVQVQKEIKVDNDKLIGSSESDIVGAKKISLKPTSSAVKPRTGTGLSSVLGQIGKKNKLSVLEKTQLDWTGFKRTEGIDEELQTFNKGRDGYLQRQDFLERTDLRRFEIEKNLRQVTRKK